jgi:hypothetical protein
MSLLLNHHPNFANGRIFTDCRFEITEFDAKSSNFHLTVCATSDYESTVVLAKGGIASPEHSHGFAGHRDRRVKALSSERRVV